MTLHPEEPSVWISRVALLEAGLVGFLVGRRAPHHRPIALALILVVLIDVLRTAIESAQFPEKIVERASLLLMLFVPALSAWLALRVFRALARPLRWCAIAWIFSVPPVLWPRPTRWWDGIYPCFAGVSLLAQVGAVALFLRRNDDTTIAQRVVGVLLLVDIAAFIASCWGVPAHVMAYQGAIGGVVVLALEVRWLVDQRSMRKPMGSDFLG